MELFRGSVSYLLIQMMKAHRYLAETLLNDLGLHAGQEMILFHLWQEDGATQSQIAEWLCVEPPTVTKMVQRMEAAGLVEKRQDTQDARVSRVYLTAHSKSLEPAVNEVWRKLEAQTVANLSEAEQMLLRRLLMQMRDNLDKKEE